ncbi:helix-turn-helix domain-containing protein [Flavobacterium lacus]|uniref:Helix-turn-helix protein n=1 Tax=Flavobacterium lacus TaxID=1353778 RepID=A0A328WVC5_9FLAO|nr:helix-turn-helix domain-containing protein [Flavobacterium lacus]RAR49076.1 helix-turn-helix protein [Flavobacterium lacus]
MEDSKKDNDIFITQKPASNKISKYISYYYFHKSEDQNYQKNFIFYPNYKHALTVYKDSEVLISNDESSIKPSKNSGLQPLYSINKEKSIKVSICGAFDKIGVVFNPLGINHFIEKPLHEIITFYFGNFTHFGDEFNLILSQVYSEKEVEKKVILLDHFFEKKLKSFDEPILKKALGEIIISNGGIKVAELSEKLKVNRKTLLRLFNKHTFMSVEEYRKMVMFRQAFNYFHQNKDKTNLTDVALFSMYYDQAHFIKHFKSITKETPNTLLSKVSHLGLEDTYWYFEN